MLSAPLMQIDVKWPFSVVVDTRGHPTGWVVVHSRVLSAERQDLLADLRWRGFRFIGMTSDGAFPLDGAGDDIDYAMLCEAWCHCFRHPDAYLPAGSPRALVSQSDFTDLLDVRANVGPAPSGGPHDFVYAGAAEGWKREAKNEPLARRCIEALTTELGLHGLAVGAPAMSDLPGVDVVPSMPWPAFLAALSTARFLLVPNGQDASPRVLAEALCLDVPAVVHRDILGGWKYVNRFTGELFTDEADVSTAARRCLTRPRSPGAWFRTHFGPYHSGRRLASLVRRLEPSLPGDVVLRLSDVLEPGPARPA